MLTQSTAPEPEPSPAPRRKAPSRLAIGLVALGVTAILGVGAWLVWTWSQRAARDLAPPTDVELDTEDILRRQVEIHQLEKDRLATGAQILFGFAVLAGLVLTWLRIRVTDRQADAALQNAKTAQTQAQTAQDQMELARRQQTAGRFTQAIEQLGHDKLDIRLGGIYALEKIARDEPVEYFSQFRQVLSSFVRESGREPHVDEDGERTRLPTDLQAALTVLGRNPSSPEVNDPARIDWSDAHLERAHLQKAHLEGAKLFRAHLEGADLRGAHLEGADLGRARLESAHLGVAYLEGAVLRGAHLEGVVLEGARLEHAVLEGTHLEDARLKGAHLEGAVLRGAHLEGAVLVFARLEGAVLVGARLEGAHLQEAHLEDAALWRAHLEGADLQNAHLEGADLERAHYDRKTRFPEGFTPPEEMIYERRKTEDNEEGSDT